jgi:hypothetical protein
MKKLTKSPVIDLTPFMLINFYSKPRLMELNMPDSDCDKICSITCGYMGITARTLFLDKDIVYCNKGVYLWEKDTLQRVAYTDLRSYILKQEDKMDKDKKEGLYSPNEGIIYLIKPLTTSRYENMVDVLDEMTICDVGTYAIVD